MLIPAYKDMDPYDLPDEFSHLQAQDMSKLGFMQDLIRGVKKMVENNTYKHTIQETGISNEVSGNVIALTKRGYMALEDSEWDKADDFFEQALNQDAELAEAYLGKLMAELQIRTKEKLKDCKEPFDNMSNYQRTLRFAEGTLRKELVGYIEYINTRNEIAKKNAILEKAKNEMDEGVVSSYEYAITLLESISGWKYADKLVCECKNKIGEIKTAAEADRLERERQAEIARKEAERIAKRNKKIAIIAMPIVCAIIAFIIVLDTVIIPNNKYNDAIALMDAGKYIEAITAFGALNGYKDSVEKIAECNTGILDGKYNDAIALMDAGNLDEAYRIFIELGDYKDATDKAGAIRLQKTKEQLKNIKVGSYIKFGTYEQDNNTSNGKEDIEWLVLEVKDGKALVISKYALDRQPYNTSYTAVTWETCTPRKWLNNNFLGSAFTADEKAMIPTVMVSADKNPDYSTYPGNATQDQVFLLSITEANKYFSSDSARQCKPTEFAVAGGANVNSSNGNCWWWLRSPGGTQRCAACVFDDGFVGEYGYGVDDDDCGVRPAMWIDIGID